MTKSLWIRSPTGLVTAPPSPPTSTPLVSGAVITITSTASDVPMERLEMDQLSGQPTNIFNPGNKLFPLGITAVSIAGKSSTTLPLDI